ncbi:MAG: hypothetical protein H6975_07365 [Gammaproteobacteria bacterium]|nr:hypothetical protein [Gammaproteobacteria bacterium]
MSKPNGLKFITLTPGCGYGDAAGEYLAGLDALGIPVTWMPTIDNTAERLDRTRSCRDLQDAINERVSYLWGRSMDCNALLLNVPPGYWHTYWLHAEPELRPFTYVAWEVDRLPADWPPALNPYERVFVPSEFNRQTFIAGGITTAVDVVPHIARRIDPMPGGPNWGDISDEDFVFYTIGAWTTRKAMEETIRAYLETFSGDEKVALIVKTEPVNQIEYRTLPKATRATAPAHLATTWWTLARILADYRNPAKIHLVSGRAPPREIDRLHTRGDCFVSLTHSEGWGLGAFDAALFGNPVIITGWSGPLDYLGENYPLLVRYRLEATIHAPDDGYFLHAPDAYWACADRRHAGELMRSVFDNPEPAKRMARARQTELQTRFAPTAVCRQLADLMGFSVGG